MGRGARAGSPSPREGPPNAPGAEDTRGGAWVLPVLLLMVLVAVGGCLLAVGLPAGEEGAAAAAAGAPGVALRERELHGRSEALYSRRRIIAEDMVSLHAALSRRRDVPKPPTPRAAQHAYAVLVSDDTVDDTLTLGDSLRVHSTGVQRGEAVLVCLAPEGRLAAAALNRLRAQGWHVVAMRDAAPDFAGVPHAASLNTFHAFGLTQFQRVVVLDSGMRAVGDADSAFATPLPGGNWVGAVGVDGGGDGSSPRFDTHLLVIQPTRATYNDLWRWAYTDAAAPAGAMRGGAGMGAAAHTLFLRAYFSRNHVPMSRGYAYDTPQGTAATPARPRGARRPMRERGGALKGEGTALSPTLGTRRPCDLLPGSRQVLRSEGGTQRLRRPDAVLSTTYDNRTAAHSVKLRHGDGLKVATARLRPLGTTSREPESVRPRASVVSLFSESAAGAPRGADPPPQLNPLLNAPVVGAPNQLVSQTPLAHSIGTRRRKQQGVLQPVHAAESSPRRAQAGDGAGKGRGAVKLSLPCGIPLIDQNIVNRNSVWHWMHRFDTCGDDMEVTYFRPSRNAAFIPAGWAAPPPALQDAPTPQRAAVPAHSTLPSLAHFVPKFSLELVPRALIDVGNCYRFERGYVLLTEDGVDVEQDASHEYLAEALSVYRMRCIAPFLVVKLPIWKVFTRWRGAMSRQRFDLAQGHLAQSLFVLHPALGPYIRSARDVFFRMAAQRISSFADTPCGFGVHAQHRYMKSDDVTGRLHEMYKDVVGFLRDACRAYIDAGEYNGRSLEDLLAVYMRLRAAKRGKVASASDSGSDDDDAEQLSYGERGYVEAQLQRLRGFLAYTELHHTTALVDMAVGSAQQLLQELRHAQQFTLQLSIDMGTRQLAYVPRPEAAAKVLDKNFASIKAIASLIPSLAEDPTFADYFMGAGKPPPSKVGATLDMHEDFMAIPDLIAASVGDAVARVTVFRTSLRGVADRYARCMERVAVFADPAAATAAGVEALEEDLDAVDALRGGIQAIADATDLPLFFVATESLRSALLPAIDAAMRTVLDGFPRVVQHVNATFEAVLGEMRQQGAIQPKTARELRAKIEFGYALQAGHAELEAGRRNCAAYVSLYERLIRDCRAGSEHNAAAVEGSLQYAWDTYLEVQRRVDTDRGELLEMYRLEYKIMYGTMCREVHDVAHEAADPKFDTPSADAAAMVAETAGLVERLRGVHTMLEGYNAFHAEVGLPEENIADLDESMQGVEEMHRLWCVWRGFVERREGWNDTLLRKLDTSAMAAALTATGEQIHRAAAEGSAPPSTGRRRLVGRLSDELQRYCGMLPAIDALSSRCLTAPHFLALDRILCWEHEHPRSASPNLKLGDLNDRCISVADRLTRVARTAVLERSIAADFDTVKRHWYQGELATGSVTGVAETEHVVFANVDDLEHDVAAMAGSLRMLAATPEMELVSSALRRNIEDFERRAQKAHDTLRTLGAAQRLWKDLEPIFGSLELQRSLGHDARMFTEFDKAFREAVRKIQTNGRTMELLIAEGILTIVEGLHTKGVANAGFFTKCISRLLSRRREVQPRLCVLSDTALMTALATYPKIPNHPTLLGALGEGIVDVVRRSINKGTDVSIEGLVTSDTTALAFAKPLVAPRTVDRFLAQVVYNTRASMAQVVAQHVKAMLPAEGGGRVVADLAELVANGDGPPSQVVLLLWRVHHSYVLRSARAQAEAVEDAAAHCRDDLRGGLKEAVQQLKNNGNAASTMVMHTLVTLMLHEQHTLAALGLDPTGRVEYMFDASTEEVSLSTSVGGKDTRVPYGNELIGGRFVEPLHVSPAFALLVRSSAAAGGVQMLRGQPVSVRDLGYLAGRQVLDVHISELWDEVQTARMLSLRLLGAVACGWWAVVRNLDAFGIDIPSTPDTPPDLLHVATSMAPAVRAVDSAALKLHGLQVAEQDLLADSGLDMCPTLSVMSNGSAMTVGTTRVAQKVTRAAVAESTQRILAAVNSITEPGSLDILHAACGARVPLDHLQGADGSFPNYVVCCTVDVGSGPPPAVGQIVSSPEASPTVAPQTNPDAAGDPHRLSTNSFAGLPEAAPQRVSLGAAQPPEQELTPQRRSTQKSPGGGSFSMSGRPRSMLRLSVRGRGSADNSGCNSPTGVGVADTSFDGSLRLSGRWSSRLSGRGPSMPRPLVVPAQLSAQEDAGDVIPMVSSPADTPLARRGGDGSYEYARALSELYGTPTDDVLAHDSPWLGKVRWVDRVAPPSRAQLVDYFRTSLTVACLNVGAASKDISDVVGFVCNACHHWRGRGGPPPMVVAEWVCSAYVAVSCDVGLQTSLEFVAHRVCGSIAVECGVAGEVALAARRLAAAQVTQAPALGEDGLPAPFLPAITEGLMRCAAGLPLCVTGESGAGKTPILRYIAQRLHMERATIVPNACCARELFGHFATTRDGSLWVDGLLGSAVAEAKTKLFVVFDGSPTVAWFNPLRELLAPPHAMRFASTDTPFAHGNALSCAFETRSLVRAPPSFLTSVLVLHVPESTLGMQETILWHMQAFFVRAEAEGEGRKASPELCRLVSQALAGCATAIEAAIKMTVVDGCHVVPVTERHLAENVGSLLTALVVDIDATDSRADTGTPVDERVRRAVHFAALWGIGGSCTREGRARVAAALDSPLTLESTPDGGEWGATASAAGYVTGDARRCAALAQHHLRVGRSVALHGPAASGKTSRIDLVLDALAPDAEPFAFVAHATRRMSFASAVDTISQLVSPRSLDVVSPRSIASGSPRSARAPRVPHHIIVRFGMRRADSAVANTRLRGALHCAARRGRALVVVVEDLGCCRPAPNPCEVLREAIHLRIGRRLAGDAHNPWRTCNELEAFGTRFPAPAMLASLQSTTAHEMRRRAAGEPCVHAEHPLAQLLQKTSVIAVAEGDVDAAVPKICAMLVNRALTLNSPLHYLLPEHALSRMFSDLQQAAVDGRACVTQAALLRCCRVTVGAVARATSASVGALRKEDVAGLAMDVAALQLLPDAVVRTQREVLCAGAEVAGDSMDAGMQVEEPHDAAVRAADEVLEELRGVFGESLYNRMGVKLRDLEARDAGTLDDGMVEFAGRMMGRSPMASEMTLLRYIVQHMQQSAHILAVFDDVHAETERSRTRAAESFTDLLRYAAEYLGRAFADAAALAPRHMDQLLCATAGKVCPTVLLHARGTPVSHMALDYTSATVWGRAVQCVFVETLRAPATDLPDSVRRQCSVLLFNSTATFPSIA